MDTNQTKKLTMIEAIKALLAGFKIRNLDWDDDSYVYLKDGCIFDEDDDYEMGIFLHNDNEFEIFVETIDVGFGGEDYNSGYSNVANLQTDLIF